jgi:hypothetical protein
MAVNKFGDWPGGPNFDRQVADVVQAPLYVTVSGEIAVSKTGLPAGIARNPGKVTGVIMSVLGVGRDASAACTLTGNVRINGTTCLTTQPVIAYVSGEVGNDQRTTHVNAADTGITAAVIDHTANSYNPGDVFTVDFIYSGDANPEVKLHNAVMMIELDPIKTI